VGLERLVSAGEGSVSLVYCLGAMRACQPHLSLDLHSLFCTRKQKTQTDLPCCLLGTLKTGQRKGPGRLSVHTCCQTTGFAWQEETADLCRVC